MSVLGITEVGHHSWNVNGRYRPHLFGVHAMVVMSKHDPQAPDVSPSDCCMPCPKIFTQRSGGLANDLQQTLYCGLERWILVKRLKATQESCSMRRAASRMSPNRSSSERLTGESLQTECPGRDHSVHPLRQRQRANPTAPRDHPGRGGDQRANSMARIRRGSQCHCLAVPHPARLIRRPKPPDRGGAEPRTESHRGERELVPAGIESLLPPCGYAIRPGATGGAAADRQTSLTDGVTRMRQIA